MIPLMSVFQLMVFSDVLHYLIHHPHHILCVVCPKLRTAKRTGVVCCVGYNSWIQEDFEW